MQFFAAIALFAASAIAGPMGSEGCPGGLTGTVPKCCAADVLDLVAADCHTPSAPIPDAGAFQRHCAGRGLQAQCCTLGLADLELLCSQPIGVQ